MLLLLLFRLRLTGSCLFVCVQSNLDAGAPDITTAVLDYIRGHDEVVLQGCDKVMPRFIIDQAYHCLVQVYCLFVCLFVAGSFVSRKFVEADFFPGIL